MFKITSAIIFQFLLLVWSGTSFSSHAAENGMKGIAFPADRETDHFILGDSLVSVTRYQFPEPHFDNHLRAIYKESEDFIWLASRRGTYQFDGINTRLFSSFDVQAGGINKIRTDQNVDLWCWRIFIYKAIPPEI